MNSTTTTMAGSKKQGMDEIDLSHLAGLIDGNGNISIKVSKEKDYTLGYTFRPEISIRRQTEDDPVLGKLVAYSEEYGVQYSTYKEENLDGGISFVVKDRDSIVRFLEPLLPYLITKYFIAESLLEEVIPAMETGKHRDKEGFVELMEFVEEFRNYSANKGTKKYTKEYFVEEWSITE